VELREVEPLAISSPLMASLETLDSSGEESASDDYLQDGVGCHKSTSPIATLMFTQVCSSLLPFKGAPPVLEEWFL